MENINIFNYLGAWGGFNNQTGPILVHIYPLFYINLHVKYRSNMMWNGCKHFVYFCVCEILKVQSHFWLILTADPDGLMVVMNTCDPHLISGSTPRVAQWLIMEWNGCKHFVYFCVCEILKVQSLLSWILAQWLIMEWNGCKHFVYFCVCEILKVQSHFWLILTADPDGLMVVMTPILFLPPSYFWWNIKSMWNIKSSESFLTDPDGRSRWFDGCHEYMWPPSYFWIYPQGGTVAYYGVKWV